MTARPASRLPDSARACNVSICCLLCPLVIDLQELFTFKDEAEAYKYLLQSKGPGLPLALFDSVQYQGLAPDVIAAAGGIDKAFQKAGVAQPAALPVLSLQREVEIDVRGTVTVSGPLGRCRLGLCPSLLCCCTCVVKVVGLCQLMPVPDHVCAVHPVREP